MSRSEQRRRQLHFERARRRWKAMHPARKFALDHGAVYVAPEAIRPRLPSDEEA